MGVADTNTNTLRLGVVQLTSTDDIPKNIETVLKYYQQAVEQRADLVVFPENSLFHRIRGGSRVLAIEVSGEVVQRIADVVRTLKVPLMLTTAVQAGGAKADNSTLLFDEVGHRVIYSKIHLFDVDVEGAPPVRESDHFRSGAGPKMVEIKGWKFGLSICYDLRFSELYLKYAQRADVILVPSAFLVPTGEAHWQVLLRARAIEAQCFVAAPAQGGTHQSESGPETRQTFGHSLVIDPWGRVLDENLAGPGVHVVELRRELLVKARGQIPMASHRRL
jgi:predicted amidohydrolase